ASGQMDPARYDSYRGNVTIFRDWVGANEPVCVITAAKLEQFQAYLLLQVAARREWERSPEATPGRKKDRKPGYSPVYAHSVLVAVKRLVGRLADHGLISAGKLGSLRIEKGVRKVETFEAEELKALPDACIKVGQRTRLCLLLMMNCGMYQSDISDLG